MSSTEVTTVNINIMDRELKIKCPENKKQALQEAADYLQTKMRDIHKGDRFTTIDRIAIMAALNIAYELIEEKQQTQSYSYNINKRIHQIKNKIDEVLIADDCGMQ